MKTAQDTAPLSGHSTIANSTVTIATSQSRALLCSSGEFNGSGGVMGMAGSRPTGYHRSPGAKKSRPQAAFCDGGTGQGLT